MLRIIIYIIIFYLYIFYLVNMVGSSFYTGTGIVFDISLIEDFSFLDFIYDLNNISNDVLVLFEILHIFLFYFIFKNFFFDYNFIYFLYYILHYYFANYDYIYLFFYVFFFIYIYIYLYLFIFFLELLYKFIVFFFNVKISFANFFFFKYIIFEDLRKLLKMNLFLTDNTFFKIEYLFFNIPNKYKILELFKSKSNSILFRLGHKIIFHNILKLFFQEEDLYRFNINFNKYINSNSSIKQNFLNIKGEFNNQFNFKNNRKYFINIYKLIFFFNTRNIIFNREKFLKQILSFFKLEVAHKSWFFKHIVILELIRKNIIMKIKQEYKKLLFLENLSKNEIILAKKKIVILKKKEEKIRKKLQRERRKKKLLNLGLIRSGFLDYNNNNKLHFSKIKINLNDFLDFNKNSQKIKTNFKIYGYKSNIVPYFWIFYSNSKIGNEKSKFLLNHKELNKRFITEFAGSMNIINLSNMNSTEILTPELINLCFNFFAYNNDKLIWRHNNRINELEHRKIIKDFSKNYGEFIIKQLSKKETSKKKNIHINNDNNNKIKKKNKRNN